MPEQHVKLEFDSPLSQKQWSTIIIRYVAETWTQLSRIQVDKVFFRLQHFIDLFAEWLLNPKWPIFGYNHDKKKNTNNKTCIYAMSSILVVTMDEYVLIGLALGDGI